MKAKLITIFEHDLNNDQIKHIEKQLSERKSAYCYQAVLESFEIDIDVFNVPVCIAVYIDGNPIPGSDCASAPVNVLRLDNITLDQVVIILNQCYHLSSNNWQKQEHNLIGRGPFLDETSYSEVEAKQIALSYLNK